MTEKQQELYIKTKARLRRMGAENPADVIVALAEEIDRYREKIHTMEEFIAKRKSKRGNESALVAELRNKTSRDNRDLLDRAANWIEELEAGYRKQSEGEWYVNYMMSKSPSKRGRTIHYETYTCSVCGKSNGRKKPNYCPNCGAKMKGE